LLRVDVEALVRGRIHEGDVCEIAGVGPVSVTAARALLGESVLKLVTTTGVDVVNVTNLGRGPKAAQKIALLWSSPECTVAGGTRRRRIEHDHRDPWTAVHETTTGNLDRYCDHHHDLKTRHGWALVPGTGKRPMVPPEDQRHLNNQSPHPAPDPPPARHSAVDHPRGPDPQRAGPPTQAA
jgi:hypothetical protein